MSKKRRHPLMSMGIMLGLALWVAGPISGVAAQAPDPEGASPPKERPLNVLEGRVLDAKTHEPIADAVVAIATTRDGYVYWDPEHDVTVNAPDASFLLVFKKHNGKRGDKTETDREGRFTFRGLAHGTYNLAVIRPGQGYTLKEDIEYAKDGDPLEILVNPPAESGQLALEGKVVDGDGKPLADIWVGAADAENGQIGYNEHVGMSAYSFNMDTMSSWFQTRNSEGRAGAKKTGEDGRFAIRGLLPGKYHVAAYDPEKGRALLPEVLLEKDSKPLELTLAPVEKQQTLEVKGRVLNYEGKPVPGASVAIADSANGRIYAAGMGSLFAYNSYEGDAAWFQSDPGREGTGEVTTDSDGKFSFPPMAVTATGFNLVAVHPKEGAVVLKDVELTKKTLPLEVRLDEPSFISGRIKGLKTGGGLLDGSMSCSLSPTGLPKNVDYGSREQLSRGHFEAGPLPRADKWTLTIEEYVQQQGYSAVVLSAPIKPEKGKTTKLNVDLSKGAALAGQVRGPKDESLSGVSVLAKAADDSGWAYGAISDKDGKYEIQGLPDGKFILEVMRHAVRTGPG